MISGTATTSAVAIADSAGNFPARGWKSPGSHRGSSFHAHARHLGFNLTESEIPALLGSSTAGAS